MFRVLCLLCIISIFLQLVVSKNFIEKKSEDKNALRGGTSNKTTKKGEFYYMVSITRYIDIAKLYLNVCGGALIGESKVLAMAHCFEREGNSCQRCSKKAAFRKASRFIAVSGSHRDKKGFKAKYQRQIIQRLTTPKGYWFPKKDIAIAHTKSPFVFDKNVNAIPYATKFKDYGSITCMFTGFGGKDYHKIQVEQIFYIAEITLVPDKKCSQRHGTNMEDFICTSDLKSYAQKEYSGGALVCAGTKDPNDKGDGVVVGLECGLYKGKIYFTRVSAHSAFLAKSCEAFFPVPYIIWLSLVVSNVYKSTFTK